jgi:hypothetical protein
MIICTHSREQLSAYLDGVVSAAEKKSIEEHLSQCEDCRLVLAELKKTQEALHNLEEVEPPPWFAQKIMNRVHEETGSRKGLLRRLFFPLHIKIPVETFATCLIVVLALFIYKSTAPEMKALHEPQEALTASPKEQQQKQSGRASSTLKEIDGQSGGISKKDSKQQMNPPAPAPFADSAGGSPPIKDMPHTPSPAGVPERQMAEKGFAETESRYKAKMNETEVLKKQEPAAAQKTAAAPFAKQKAENTSPAVSSATKDTLEGTKSPAGLEFRTTPVIGIKPILFTVSTNTLETTVKDTEDILNRFNAKNIKKNSRQPRSIVLDADLPGQKVRDFFNALSTVGNMKEKDTPENRQQEYVAVSIEIKANP